MEKSVACKYGPFKSCLRGASCYSTINSEVMKNKKLQEMWHHQEQQTNAVPAACDGRNEVMRLVWLELELVGLERGRTRQRLQRLRLNVGGEDARNRTVNQFKMVCL
jgi:hypothetical protein